MSRKEIATKAKLANNGHLTQQPNNLQLTDMFTFFHHTFAKRNTTDAHYWSNMTGTPTMSTWPRRAYERVCILHIPQIKQASGISGIATGEIVMGHPFQ